MNTMHALRLISLTISIATAVTTYAGNATSQKPGFSMSLTLVPGRVLPGLPVTFRVTLTNLSNVPADIPQDLRLEVDPMEGERFYARALDLDSHSPPTTFGRWPREISTLGSKEALSVVFPVGPTLVGPEWFRDPRLNKPGVYRLRLLLYPAKPQPVLNERASGEPVENLEEPVVSNTATLTVQEPDGEDARVWEWMQSVAAPEGWNTTMLFGSDIAREVWANHPNSRYLAYVAPLLRSTDSGETVRALRAAIAVDPAGPQSDWLKVVLGAYYMRLATEATYVHGGDLAKAYAFADLAREEFRQLLSHAKTPEMRHEAELGLARVPERSQLQELHELSKNRKEQ
jgi:hypothetical protein